MRSFDGLSAAASSRTKPITIPGRRHDRPDDAESWTGFGGPGQGAGTCNVGGCDLYYVALHEIGHALGQEHPFGDETNAPAGPFQAVMSPLFNPIGGANPGFGTYDTLQPENIAGLQAIYGIGVVP